MLENELYLEAILLNPVLPPWTLLSGNPSLSLQYIALVVSFTFPQIHLCVDSKLLQHLCCNVVSDS